MHPYSIGFLKECKKQDIHLGFVTNGLGLNNKDWWDTVAKTCKFVGFSIDAGNAKDYANTKGVPEDFFDSVIHNLESIAEAKKRLKTECQIGYKYVLDEMNYNNIYNAAFIASQIGVNHFQFRPALNPDYKFFEDKLDFIWNQIRSAQDDLEREDFRIFGVQHKFNKNLSKKHKFEKCRATMLTTTWCADGSVTLCTDTRGNPWSKLIDHYPNPDKVINYWGSKEHFNKVDKINFKSNCDRCTLSAYNEFFEQIFIKDNMDRNLI